MSGWRALEAGEQDVAAGVAAAASLDLQQTVDALEIGMTVLEGGLWLLLAIVAAWAWRALRRPRISNRE